MPEKFYKVGLLKYWRTPCKLFQELRLALLHCPAEFVPRAFEPHVVPSVIVIIDNSEKGLSRRSQFGKKPSSTVKAL